MDEKTGKVVGYSIDDMGCGDGIFIKGVKFTFDRTTPFISSTVEMSELSYHVRKHLSTQKELVKMAHMSDVSIGMKNSENV